MQTIEYVARHLRSHSATVHIAELAVLLPGGVLPASHGPSIPQPDDPIVSGKYAARKRAISKPAAKVLPVSPVRSCKDPSSTSGVLGFLIQCGIHASPYDGSMMIASLLITVVASLVPQQEQLDLTPKNLDAVLERILPEDPELRWKNVNWRVSLAEGIVDAKAAEKPILLWAMNGHPLGCV